MVDNLSSPSADGSKIAFGAKGLVFQGARDFYEKVVPGGYAAVTEAMGNETLRRFSVQPFVASGWDDVMPIIPLATASARLRGVPYPKQVRDNARWIAERDLAGVYRMIVSLASVEMFALRLPRLSMRYFDFGSADGKMVRDGLMESRRFGIPAPLAKWFVLVTEGFVPYALSLAGAKKVTVRCGPPRSEGTKEGVPIVRLRFDISWE